MKKIMLAMAALLLAACSPAASEPQQATEFFIPTVTTAATPMPSATPEPTQDPNDFQTILSSTLNNPVEVWWENPKSMAENTGGQFGFVAMKNYNEYENVFEFASPDENAWVALNTGLDEFGENRQPGSAQAILFSFIAPEHPERLIFDFMGPNEFGVDFQDGAKPALFWFIEAYKEPFAGEFTLEAGKPYNILMAIDQNGAFMAQIWENGNYEKHSSFAGDFSTRQNGEGYKNQSWKFIIGFEKGDTLKIAEYKVYTFDTFK